MLTGTEGEGVSVTEMIRLLLHVRSSIEQQQQRKAMSCTSRAAMPGWRVKDRDRKFWRLGSRDGCCGGLAVATSCQRLAADTKTGVRADGRKLDCVNSLPDEILRDILTLLPLCELLRLRAVCRTWDRLILEDGRVVQVKDSCGACFLRAVRTRDGKMMALAYNPVLRMSSPTHLALHASPVEFGHFITAAGSLLFYGNFNNCAPVCRITVSNPLSNTWRRLPLLADGPTPLSFPAFRRITVWTLGPPPVAGGGRSQYKILVVKFRCHFQTHMYDSLADFWKPCPSIPLCGYDFFTDLYTSTGPCVGGIAFYVVGNSVRDVRSWSIWAFDLEGEAWFNFAVPDKVLEGVVSYVLTECLGHLVLVARCGTVDWEKRCIHVDSVRLWELKLTRRRKACDGRVFTAHSWVKIGDMPQHMVLNYSHFYSKRHWWHPTLELRDCTVVTHCIFFLKGRSQGSDAIMYDFLEGSWSMPCKDAVQLPRGCRMYEPGFCYTPNAASVP